MELLVSVLTASSILVLLVMGMAIIVSMMGIFNLAHGEFVLLGAVMSYAFQDAGFHPLFALLSAVVVVALIGGVVDVLVVRHFYFRPLPAVLATWGVGLVIREIVRAMLGSSAKRVKAPISGVTSIAGHQAETWRYMLIPLSLAVVGVTAWFIYRSAPGLRIRATLADPDLAATAGIRTRLVYTATFMYGAALAGLAGGMIAPLNAFFPEFGALYLVRSFLAVMVGGVGGLMGPVMGAALIGTADVGLARLITPSVAQGLVVVGAVVVMRFRPGGLLRRNV